MGNRANVVVVEGGDWQLYYSHWAGCRMLDMLIGGPDYARRYIDSLRRCAKTEWTDPAWADGGAVIDIDRRRLLFFGDGLMVGMDERRAMLAVLADVWADYEVGWAYDGTLELAGYVGVELGPVEWDRKPNLIAAQDRNALCHLVSVVAADGTLRMWPLWWHLSKAWHGPALLHSLPGRGIKSLTLGKIPEGGVHIDVPQHAVGAWQTADTVGIFEALPDVWEGWNTECWEDRYDEQVTRCGGSLRVPQLDLQAGIESALSRIEKRVFETYEDSPAGHVLALATMLSGVEPGLAVTPDAVADCATRPSAREWDHFVQACNGRRSIYTRSA